MMRGASALGLGDITTETPVSWVGKASYWSPTHVVPSAWHEHAPFAFWLVDALRPTTFVELGSHNGFSYFAVCEAVQRLGLDTSCSAIDSWEGDEHAGFYGDDVYRSVTEINEASYSGFSRLIRSYFSDAVDQFEDGSIELLHIDGRHRYEDAVEDFETYRPKLAATAVVIFHDTFEFERGFGVHRLWAELCERYPESTFQFEHGHGLGVLGLGDLPQPLVDFFAPTTHASARSSRHGRASCRSGRTPWRRSSDRRPSSVPCGCTRPSSRSSCSGHATASPR
jgi:hypothetical protein